MGEMLKGKVAVVTGAGRGIGRGIALLLAEEGAKVVVNDLGAATDGKGTSASPADEVVAEIKRKGGAAVANYDSVALYQNGEKIIKTAVDKFGRIDILVNNAGILRDRIFWNMTEEEWDAVINVHLKGTFNCTRFASILMRQQRSGCIINISSMSGLIGNPGQSNYGAAKSGIGGFTKVVARDVGRYGVRCNCVVPHALTRMTEGLKPYVEARIRRGEEVPEMMRNFPDPSHTAPLVAYLASDEAANINGQFFFVFGSQISVLSQPRPLKTIFKEERWTVEELLEIIPKTLAKDLVNPAPPEPATAKREA